jgi:hypothetical protein
MDDIPDDEIEDEECYEMSQLFFRTEEEASEREYSDGHEEWGELYDRFGIEYGKLVKRYGAPNRFVVNDFIRMIDPYVVIHQVV